YRPARGLAAGHERRAAPARPGTGRRPPRLRCRPGGLDAVRSADPRRAARPAPRVVARRRGRRVGVVRPAAVDARIAVMTPDDAAELAIGLPQTSTRD